MPNGTQSLVWLGTSILLFPTLFQEDFVRFAWGEGDQVWVMLAKRLFLLLPALAVILGCWLTVASMLTVPVRQNRREFITAIFMTWWDLGKSILLFWGGTVKLALRLVAALLGVARFTVFAVWAIVQDIVMIPLGIVRDGARVVMSSPVPWVAVTLTISWCIIETTIFTYVTSPLVIDTFSNITGEQLSANAVRIPLALFLFCVVLGSYAVLATFVDSLKSKNISSILGIGAIETVVLFVEVVFLYREFVDSLVPWFAQYSEDFELGVFQTLAVSCFVWFGVRSLSWFLFASHGTPMIMSVIQGKKLELPAAAPRTRGHFFTVAQGFMETVKRESEWVKKTGSELVDAFMLPPLQVMAASINFCTLLLLTDHLFALPFEDITSVRFTEKLGGTIARLGGYGAKGARKRARAPKAWCAQVASSASRAGEGSMAARRPDPRRAQEDSAQADRGRQQEREVLVASDDPLAEGD